MTTLHRRVHRLAGSSAFKAWQTRLKSCWGCCRAGTCRAAGWLRRGWCFAQRSARGLVRRLAWAGQADQGMLSCCGKPCRAVEAVRAGGPLERGTLPGGAAAQALEARHVLVMICRKPKGGSGVHIAAINRRGAVDYRNQVLSVVHPGHKGRGGRRAQSGHSRRGLRPAGLKVQTIDMLCQGARGLHFRGAGRGRARRQTGACVGPSNQVRGSCWERDCRVGISLKPPRIRGRGRSGAPSLRPPRPGRACPRRRRPHGPRGCWHR